MKNLDTKTYFLVWILLVIGILFWVYYTQEPEPPKMCQVIEDEFDFSCRTLKKKVIESEDYYEKDYYLKIMMLKCRYG